MHSDAQARVEAALYVVATPLGNLRDITLRALDVLAAADAVAAEDTRLTRKLLAHYELHAPLIAVHEHNEAHVASSLIKRIAEGQAIAYVTDAGTPAISDPGALLVSRVRDAGLRVIPVPGPSALTATLSAAGVALPHFLFYGFLPANARARRKALARLAPLPFGLVFFEAPHRLRDSLEDMAEILGPYRWLVVARELTKFFESIHKGTLGEASAWIDQESNRSKGEFVLVVEGAERDAAERDDRAERVLAILLRELPLSRAVELATEIVDGKRNILYARALELRKQSEGDAVKDPSKGETE
ncbi:MAG: 16S rRNA (cytidine(1402)-2'-O)-methyltransferase [Proteobacteria bacterium]|nr:MAG: 16S rRNA (cytidine(1402)-2'-O)-methyltransferase [Pseudomonadota bacterium]